MPLNTLNSNPNLPSATCSSNWRNTGLRMNQEAGFFFFFSGFVLSSWEKTMRKKCFLSLGLGSCVLAVCNTRGNLDRAPVLEINNPCSYLSTISERKFYSILNWILSCCNLSLLPPFPEWNCNSLSLKFTGAAFLRKTRNWLLELAFSPHLCLPVPASFSDSQKVCICFNELVHNRFLCYLRKQFPSVHILLKSNGFLLKKKKKV